MLPLHGETLSIGAEGHLREVLMSPSVPVLAFEFPAQMLFEEQLTALGGQNLINFLLRDDIPCPEILEEENCPPEDCSVSEAVVSSLVQITARFRRFESPLSKRFFSTAPG